MSHILNAEKIIFTWRDLVYGRELLNEMAASL
jgi:predicted nucleotidyltransferase